MKRLSPRALRIKKKHGPKPFEFNFTTIVLDVASKDLPPYGEYKPNRIHVARRREAWQEHKAFPRGWVFEEEDFTVEGSASIGTTTSTSTSTSTVGSGGLAMVKKELYNQWKVYGAGIS